MNRTPMMVGMAKERYEAPVIRLEQVEDGGG